jgi:hypothetical protein
MYVRTYLNNYFKLISTYFVFICHMITSTYREQINFNCRQIISYLML